MDIKKSKILPIILSFVLVTLLVVSFLCPFSSKIVYAEVDDHGIAVELLQDSARAYENFVYEKTITAQADGLYYKAKLYKGNQYRLYLKALTSPFYWAGPNSNVISQEVSWTTTVTVSETHSHEVSAKFGLQVAVPWGKISGEAGYTYTNSKTYSQQESSSYKVLLTKESPAGYYALTSAINAYKYEIHILEYSDANMTNLTGDYGYSYSYIYSTDIPYVHTRYMTRAMTSNDFFFAL